MKTYVWLFLFSICHAFCYATKEKTASFYVFPGSSSDKAHYMWSINGKRVNDNSRSTLPVHYPNFDTITITEGSKKRMIITSLKKGHIYELSPGDDDHDVSIRDMTEEMSKKTKSSKNNPYTLTVIFHYLNPVADTVMAGVFGTHGKIMKGDMETRMEESEFGVFRDRLYNIRIGHGSIRREVDIYNDFRFQRFSYDEEHSFVFDEELLSFEYQFFDKKTLYIDYDGKSRDYKLTLKH